MAEEAPHAAGAVWANWIAIGATVLCFSASVFALRETLNSAVDVEVVLIHEPSRASIFNFPSSVMRRALVSSGRLHVNVKLPDVERDVYARIVSDLPVDDYLPVSNVPTAGLFVGTIGPARIQSAGIALWGPLQFPGDFWLPLTMAFLGVGFGSYALYQHRSRFPKGSP